MLMRYVFIQFVYTLDLQGLTNVKLILEQENRVALIRSVWSELCNYSSTIRVTRKMASKKQVEQVIRSLSFGVVAEPDDNKAIPASGSKSTPLNLKIRVKKNREYEVQQGFLSVPKTDHDNNIPERVRLVSSDQTIMSFHMFMVADRVIKKSKRRTRKLFGSCLGAEYDEDDLPYGPNSNTKSSHTNNGSMSLEELPRLPLLKSKINNDNDLPSYVKTSILGKCKPGGCLDPPFGEDKYSYEPVQKMVNAPLLIDEKLLGVKLKTSETDANQFSTASSEHLDSDILPSISPHYHERPIENIYIAGSLKDSLSIKQSDSIIITYKPSESTEENKCNKIPRQKKISAERQGKSDGESIEHFFSPIKTTVKKSVDGKNQSKDNKMQIPKEHVATEGMISAETVGLIANATAMAAILPIINQSKSKQVATSEEISVTNSLPIDIISPTEFTNLENNTLPKSINENDGDILGKLSVNSIAQATKTPIDTIYKDILDEDTSKGYIKIPSDIQKEEKSIFLDISGTNSSSKLPETIAINKYLTGPNEISDQIFDNQKYTEDLTEKDSIILSHIDEVYRNTKPDDILSNQNNDASYKKQEKKSADNKTTEIHDKSYNITQDKVILKDHSQNRNKAGVIQKYGERKENNASEELTKPNKDDIGHESKILILDIPERINSIDTYENYDQPINNRGKYVYDTDKTKHTNIASTSSNDNIFNESEADYSHSDNSNQDVFEKQNEPITLANFKKDRDSNGSNYKDFPSKKKDLNTDFLVETQFSHDYTREKPDGSINLTNTALEPPYFPTQFLEKESAVALINSIDMHTRFEKDFESSLLTLDTPRKSHNEISQQYRHTSLQSEETPIDTWKKLESSEMHGHDKVNSKDFSASPISTRISPYNKFTSEETVRSPLYDKKELVEDNHVFSDKVHHKYIDRQISIEKPIKKNSTGIASVTRRMFASTNDRGFETEYTIPSVDIKERSYPNKYNNLEENMTTGIKSQIKRNTTVLNSKSEQAIAQLTQSQQIERQIYEDNNLSRNITINSSRDGKKSIIDIKEPSIYSSIKDIVIVDIAFQSYVNENNERVFKTIDSSLEPTRSSEDAITIIRSQLRPFVNEIRIPIDAENNLSMKIERNKTPTPINSRNIGEIIKEVHGTQSDKGLLKAPPDNPKTKEFGNTTASREMQHIFSAIFEQDLIPLQNSIKYLKEEIDALATHEVEFRENFTKPKKTKTCVKPVRICHCSRL